MVKIGITQIPEEHADENMGPSKKKPSQPIESVGSRRKAPNDFATDLGEYLTELVTTLIVESRLQNFRSKQGEDPVVFIATLIRDFRKRMIDQFPSSTELFEHTLVVACYTALQEVESLDDLFTLLRLVELSDAQIGQSIVEEGVLNQELSVQCRQQFLYILGNLQFRHKDLFPFWLRYIKHLESESHFRIPAFLGIYRIDPVLAMKLFYDKEDCDMEIMNYHFHNALQLMKPELRDIVEWNRLPPIVRNALGIKVYETTVKRYFQEEEVDMKRHIASIRNLPMILTSGVANMEKEVPTMADY